MFALGKRNIHISVVTWCGEVKVHFRQFTVDAYGRKIPCTKGIALNVDEFIDLKANLNSIDESIRKMIPSVETKHRSSCQS